MANDPNAQATTNTQPTTNPVAQVAQVAQVPQVVINDQDDEQYRRYIHVYPKLAYMSPEDARYDYNYNDYYYFVYYLYLFTKVV